MRSSRPILFVALLWPLSFVTSMPQGVSTGIRLASGTFIDCRVPNLAYYPDPEDCRNFYHCSDWSGLQKKSCGSHLYFNDKTGVCDWPSVVQRSRPECADLATLQEHQIPPGFQKVDPSAVRGPVRFPVSVTVNPESLPDSTTPPPRARPSVGVPARFPDQAPIVLFDPNEFVGRPLQDLPVVMRFQPIGAPAPQQEFKKDTPLAPPLTAQEENRNFAQNFPPPPPVPSQVRGILPQEVRVPVQTPEPARIPAQTPEPIKIPVQTPEPIRIPVQTPEPIRIPVQTPEPVRIPVQIPEPARIPVQIPEPVRIPIQEPQEVPAQAPEPFTAFRPVVQTPEPFRPVVQSPEPFRPVVQAPEPFRVPSFQEFRIGAQPEEIPTAQTFVQPEVVQEVSNIVEEPSQEIIQEPSQEIIEEPQEIIVEPVEPPEAPQKVQDPEPVEEVRSIGVEATTTSTTSTTITSTQSTRQRFRSRQRFRPFAASSTEKPESQETQETTSTKAPEPQENSLRSSLRTSLKSRPIFNPSNRRIPLSRFRGRQQESSTEVIEETSDVNVEEVDQPEASSTTERVNVRSRFFRTRPVQNRFNDEDTSNLNTPVIRSRPLFSKRPAFKVRRPVNQEPEPEVQQEDEEEEQKVFLVCSEGKCFDPNTQEFVDTDLKASASSNPEEFLSLLDHMKVLDKSKMTPEKKNHIKFLLESAKVRPNPSNSKLKTKDLIEMLRSSGALDDDLPLDVSKKEISEEQTAEVAAKLEEDFGVMEMTRTKNEDEEAEVTTLAASVVIKEASEENEESELTTMANEEDLDALDKVASLVQSEFDEEVEVTTTSADHDEEAQTLSPVELDQEMSDQLTMTLEAVHDEVQDDDEAVTEAVQDEVQDDEAVTDEPEVATEQPAHISTFNMLKNIMEHFNLNKILDHAEAGTLEDVIKEDEIIEMTTTSPETTPASHEASSSEAASPVVIKEENEEGETVHVVLPVGWNSEEAEIVVSQPSEDVSEASQEVVTEASTEKSEVTKKENVAKVIEKENVAEVNDKKSVADVSDKENDAEAVEEEIEPSSTDSPSTTTSSQSPRTFDSSKLNKIRQRIRTSAVSSPSSSLDAVKIINQRINTPERHEFVPGSSEKEETDSAAEKPDAEIVGRRNELFSKRTRIQRPSPTELLESSRSSGLTSSEEQPVVNPLKSRFARLRLPEKSSDAENGAESDSDSTGAEKLKPVRCRFFGKACDETSS